MHYRQAYTK